MQANKETKKRPFVKFSKGEIILYLSSVILITVFFILFDKRSYINLAASLIGATALIFCAKGHPLGQLLIITFSVFYGIISYSIAYYGEMITYLGMSTPMALISLISWITHPFDKDNSREVKVNSIKKTEYIFIAIFATAVTVIFYFILKHFGNASLIPSTVSVTTSAIAAYLTFRRSNYFALAYALNDVVLIVLWVIAAISDISYISVVVCFVTFLVNDTYSFINWSRMKKRQALSSNAKT